MHNPVKDLFLARFGNMECFAEESEEKEKEDSEAYYRRARPFAFDEVDYFIHECSIKRRIVAMKIIRFITEKAK